MATTIEKKYDCVRAVRKERERMAGELQGKSTREIITYFQEKRRKSPVFKGKLLKP